MNEDAGSRLLSAVRQWRPAAVPMFEALLPEFSHVDALLPEVVEHRGCLLNWSALANPHLPEWFEDRFVDSQREYVLNHVHLLDVVWEHSDDAKAEQLAERLRAFLPVLAEFWTWRVEQQTEWPIEVWTAEDPEEYGPTIGYGQKR